MPRKPALEPLMTCPFTGAAIEVEELPIGLCENPMYKAKCGFWTTGWYSDKQALLHDISHRDGVAPEFPRIIRVLQETKKNEKPPQTDPAQGLGGEVDMDHVDRLIRPQT